MTKIHVSIFAIALTVASAALADIQFIDQQNLNSEGLRASPSTIFSQSFTPSMTSLNTVDAILFVSGTESVTVELTLWAGNGLGQSLRSTGYVTISPAAGPIPVEFKFLNPVAVQPGAVYTFAVDSFPRTPFSVQYGSDTYAGGNMFDSTYTYPDRDLYFQEGLTVPPAKITRSSAQQLKVQGSAPPNASVAISVSPDLSPGSFVFLGTANADASGAWQYNDTPQANLTTRFYRATWP